MTAAALAHELIEARDEKRLLRLQRQYAAYKLLIVDELGYVPLSQTGAELLFKVFSQRYERGATLVTSNLPFDQWTSIFGSERLTGALLDRLTHHVHILEMQVVAGSQAGRSRKSLAAIPMSCSPWRGVFCEEVHRSTDQCNAPELQVVGYFDCDLLSPAQLDNIKAKCCGERAEDRQGQ